MRARWLSSSSPSRYSVTLLTRSMHARSSGPAPLGSAIVPSSFEVSLQTRTNEASSLVEHSPLVLGIEAQSLPYLVRRPTFHVAEEDHLPQSLRHLPEGQARLRQCVGAINPDAEGLPGDGRLFPVARPLGMIGWKELIGRERGLRLSRWDGNVPQQDKHENGEREGADQADERDDVQALGERPA